MKRLGGRIALCALLLTVALVGSSLAASDTQTVKVGLAYSSGALASANLENSVGNGYQFGYYDGAGTFISLGSTDTTQISMLKTQNLYLAKDGTYTTVSSGSAGTIGCYHLQLPGTYSSFSAAQSKAATVTGGFPAWVSGPHRRVCYRSGCENSAKQPGYQWNCHRWNDLFRNLCDPDENNQNLIPV